MAFRSTHAVCPTDDQLDSGAAFFDAVEQANFATVGGVALGGVAAGGACFVGLAVAPTQVLTTGALAGTLLALGAVKDKHGCYLPFLNQEDDNAAPAAPVQGPELAAA